MHPRILNAPRVWYRRMRRPVKGLLQLTRYKEYVLFVTVTTLLGAKLGGGTFDHHLLIVLAANILVVGFAFMYNDVEDAPDDALDAKKARRNPISAGMISPRIGKAACLVVSVLVLGLYAMLGNMTFLLGALCLGLAFLYSWRMARLKAVPVADLLSHGLSLAGLQFLCAYFAFDQGKPYSWLFFLFVTLISVYGELNNELRDIEVDRKAGIRHTADLIGVRWTKVLMIASLIGAVALLAIFLAMEMIPRWLLIVPLVVAPMLFAEQLWHLIQRKSDVMEDREDMHEPAVLVGLVTCVVWFVADKMPYVRFF
ncbi:MAG: UbiA prenyltransferase family protein [Thermoflexales bacterium]|nr:UbiA prenyltransferase family protein [Thermoflexales bacterium]MDW8350360.1 UbiA prenyltransferase family protein [Anaerolineae bacterium]